MTFLETLGAALFLTVIITAVAFLVFFANERRDAYEACLKQNGTGVVYMDSVYWCKGTVNGSSKTWRLE